MLYYKVMICIWHLCNNKLSGQQKKFCSINCKNKFHVTKARRNIKQKLIEYFGGKCVLCGYNKCNAAMHFHHVDDNKEFQVSRGDIKSYDRALREAEKCILICANCHAEQHSVI